MSLTRTRQRALHAGFTLVQVMVGLVIGLVVFGGAIALFGVMSGSGTEATRLVRLTYHLREAIELMAREGRRAGYWGQGGRSQLPRCSLTPGATSGSGVSFTATATPFPSAAESEGYYLAGNGGLARITRWLATGQVEGDVITPFASTAAIGPGSWVLRVNPFTLAGNDLSVQESGACLTYAYDVNADAVVDDGERFGFRLRDGAVQMRIGGSGPSTCTDGAWVAVTDSAVRVTALAFQVSSVTIDLDGDAAGSATLMQRLLTIRLTGEIADDPGNPLTLERQVRLRNDVLQP